MPVALAALKPGDVVYDVRRERAGNTMMRRTAVRLVRIVDVDTENGRVLASWNSNPPRHYRARNGQFPWRRSRPANV